MSPSTMTEPFIHGVSPNADPFIHGLSPNVDSFIHGVLDMACGTIKMNKQVYPNTLQLIEMIEFMLCSLADMIQIISVHGSHL